jgi:hypothetical protein
LPGPLRRGNPGVAPQREPRSSRLSADRGAVPTSSGAARARARTRSCPAPRWCRCGRAAARRRPPPAGARPTRIGRAGSTPGTRIPRVAGRFHVGPGQSGPGASGRAPARPSVTPAPGGRGPARSVRVTRARSRRQDSFREAAERGNTELCRPCQPTMSYDFTGAGYSSCRGRRGTRTPGATLSR